MGATVFIFIDFDIDLYMRKYILSLPWYVDIRYDILEKYHILLKIGQIREEHRFLYDTHF